MNQLTKHTEPITLPEVIKSNLPSLAKLRRENEQDLRGELFKQIAKVCLFYSYEPNQLQAFQFIDFVLKEGYYLKAADITIFVDRCLNRFYKPKYKFDIAELQDWFLMYLDSRVETAIQVNSLKEPKKDKPEEQTENLPLTEKGKQVLEELSEIFKSKPKSNNINDPKGAYVSKISLEFSREAKTEIEVEIVERDGSKYKVLKPCAPYMEYGGKRLFLNEYVAARFEDFYNDVTAEWSQIEGDKISLQEYINEKIKDYVS